MEVPFYRTFLRRELARRSEKNPRYSLRAFASSLTVDPGALSRILSGKQTLTAKSARVVAERLNLSPLERRHLLQSTVDSEAAPAAETDRLELAEEQFRVIAELHHFALLELVETKGFRPDAKVIAHRLGISPLEATLTIDRLVRLGLLRWEKRRLVKTASSLTVKEKEVSTAALRRQQRQILMRAGEAVSEVPLEKRVANSVTMAIDPRRLPLARTLIVDFCRALADALEQGEQERVYQLHVSLFPLEVGDANA